MGKVQRESEQLCYIFHIQLVTFRTFPRRHLRKGRLQKTDLEVREVEFDNNNRITTTALCMAIYIFENYV